MVEQPARFAACTTSACKSLFVAVEKNSCRTWEESTPERQRGVSLDPHGASSRSRFTREAKSSTA